MSYGNECAIEQLIERELIYQHACDMAQKGIWETKDGIKLSVSKMTDNHIANCIAMLKRGNSPYADPFIEMFEKEQSKRISYLKF